MKLRMIRVADWIDDKIIRHRLYGRNGGLCHFLATSSWWGEKSCALFRLTGRRTESAVAGC